MLEPVRVMRIIYGEVSRDFGPDCCVSAVGATIDILDALYNIKSEPLCVELQIFNPYVTRKIEANDGFPKELATLKSWVAHPKGWAVAVGQDGNGKASDGTGGLNGHMVVIAIDESNNKILLDPSIAQASRPKKRMHLGPLAIPAPEEFLAGKASTGRVVRSCLHLYRAITHNKDYTKAPDWERWKRFAAMNRVIKRIVT